MKMEERDRLIREEGISQGISQGAEGIIEILYENGYSDNDIVEKLQSKLHISMQRAQEYLQMYGRQKA
jgi:hypothetical protein